MIRNRRFSRFNENHGLRRRFYEGDKFSSQEDFRMVGVAGMKFAAVAERCLKEIRDLWRIVAKRDRYGSELQYEHLLSIKDYADLAVEEYDKYMTRANNLAKNEYNVRVEGNLMPHVNSRLTDADALNSLLRADGSDVRLGWDISRLKDAASVASGETSDDGNINETARFEDVIQCAYYAKYLFTQISSLAFDVAESLERIED